MTRLSWATPSQRTFEAGVDRGVLYVGATPGVPWNGLISVTERTVDLRSETGYLDGQQFYKRLGPEEFAAKIEAFTYPDEFIFSEGFSDSQIRGSFGMCYRTRLNSDNYRLHLIYNALATVDDRAHSTINSSVDLTPFVWDVSTSAKPYLGVAPTAHLMVDTSLAWIDAISAIEDLLYGTDLQAPRLPLPSEVLLLFQANTRLKIVDHGDGTWTASGPDEAVRMLTSTEFEINGPSAIFLTEDTYQVSTY